MRVNNPLSDGQCMQIHMINVEEYGFWLSEFATVMSVIWFLNSDGLECNPYKVEVVGSNPTGTTSGDW